MKLKMTTTRRNNVDPKGKRKLIEDGFIRNMTRENNLEDPLLVKDKEMMLPTRQNKCGKRRDQLKGMQ